MDPNEQKKRVTFFREDKSVRYSTKTNHQEEQALSYLKTMGEEEYNYAPDFDDYEFGNAKSSGKKLLEELKKEPSFAPFYDKSITPTHELNNNIEEKRKKQKSVPAQKKKQMLLDLRSNEYNSHNSAKHVPSIPPQYQERRYASVNSSIANIDAKKHQLEKAQIMKYVDIAKIQESKSPQRMKLKQKKQVKENQQKKLLFPSKNFQYSQFKGQNGISSSNTPTFDDNSYWKGMAKSQSELIKNEDQRSRSPIIFYEQKQNLDQQIRYKDQLIRKLQLKRQNELPPINGNQGGISTKNENITKEKKEKIDLYLKVFMKNREKVGDLAPKFPKSNKSFNRKHLAILDMEQPQNMKIKYPQYINQQINSQAQNRTENCSTRIDTQATNNDRFFATEIEQRHTENYTTQNSYRKPVQLAKVSQSRRVSINRRTSQGKAEVTPPTTRISDFTIFKKI